MEKNGVALLRTESEQADDVPYRQAIGSLLYFAKCTPSDISHAVGTVAQFSEAPNAKHWALVKRLFRYLQGTQETGLVYYQSKTKMMLANSVGIRMQTGLVYHAENQRVALRYSPRDVSSPGKV